MDDKFLKKNKIDAHELKRDILGKKAEIAKYDIFRVKKTGELIIKAKNGKGKGYETGEYIK